jgi:hypothetical protein
MLERRKSYRIEAPRGVVRCASAAGINYYGVVDVSTGGVLVDGDSAPPLGEALDVLLLLPGQWPCVAAARVVRHDELDRARRHIALAFDDADPDVEDTIEDFIAEALVRARNPRALVATASAEDAEAVSARLHDLGFASVQVTTPLGALQALESPSSAIDTVFVGETLGGISGREFAQYLAAAHPDLRLLSPSASDPRR